ncbi:MAG TPA: prolipoprotein diacylglyceryl transferase, partial [Bacteroidales bacterium]|nr:prolipoprotein diacylglyceryl transferase [Bacteroidales bacterium]
MFQILNFIQWNVQPEIFSLGSFAPRWYGVLFAAGFLIGYYIGEKMLKSENVSTKWIDSLFFYIIIATILGARLGHVFFYGWDYYSQH